jgi:hypothetical protein
MFSGELITPRPTTTEGNNYFFLIYFQVDDFFAIYDTILVKHLSLINNIRY